MESYVVSEVNYYGAQQGGKTGPQGHNPVLHSPSSSCGAFLSAAGEFSRVILHIPACPSNALYRMAHKKGARLSSSINKHGRLFNAPPCIFCITVFPKAGDSVPFAVWKGPGALKEKDQKGRGSRRKGAGKEEGGGKLSENEAAEKHF